MKYFLHFMREGGRAEEFADLSTIEFACEGSEWKSGDYTVVDENGVEYVPDWAVHPTQPKPVVGISPVDLGAYKLVPKGST